MNNLLQENWKTILVGAAAGTLNGFFGGGAGMLLVPLLIKVCRLEAKKAFATSLCVTLSLSPVTLIAYLLRDGMPEKPVMPLVLGGAAGAALGALLMSRIPTKLLRYLLAGMMIFSAVKILYE